MKEVEIVDLFCGAGGTSSGVLHAAKQLGYKVNLTAINHWDVAIDTHSKNHPNARHLCENLDHVRPELLFPKGKVDLLCGSPECTHHSRAKGGKPRSDQSRSTAWKIVEWATALDIANILIENVPEFVEWGPLDGEGKPIKERKGALFILFIDTLKALGYEVEHKVVTCANYGDPTTRARLFIMCKKGRSPVWPAPTHSENPDNLMLNLKPWIPAQDVIDWSIEGRTISERTKKLVPATLNRIALGIKKYCREDLVDTFLDVLHEREQTSIPEVKLEEGRLTEPFIVANYTPGYVRPTDEPLPTITTSGAQLYLCEPFIVKQFGTSTTDSIKRPLSTITTSGCHHFLCEPFLVSYYGHGGVRGVGKPIPTITTKDRFGLVTIDGDKYGVNIRYRMLEPHELAAGMGFPDDYIFTGKKTEIKKQIGNAVPRMTASALSKELLREIL